MTDIIVKQMPAFKKVYKKLYQSQKKQVDEAICELITNLRIGEEKKGDVARVFVYKFKIADKLFLLAYEWNPKEWILLALGVHENFYRDLKKQC